MYIEIEETTDLKKWDLELERFEGSIFLSSSWLEEQRNIDKTPVYLYFNVNKKTKALISGLQRPVGSTSEKQLFFYSGIATDIHNSDFILYCKKKLLDYAKKNYFSRIIIKSYDYNDQVKTNISEFKPFKRTECVIDLKVNESEIINGFTKRSIKYIRKAKREGATLKYDNNPELLETLFALMKTTLNTRISRGYGGYEMFTMPFLDIEVLKKMLLTKKAYLYYIVFKGEIVSIKLLAIMAGGAYGLYMGTSPLGYQIAAPSMLIHDTALKLKKDGVSRYNLGGVPLGNKHEGVMQFKLQMGSTVVNSYEETTDFLLYPLKRLNKFLKLKRVLMSFYIPWRIKKQLLKIINLFLRNRDKY